ncbi:uncharacterized protein LOC114252765 [Bombyx mandarina]|uniref:MADF domain-containing protein n=2 Tax=Bombyx TaxID=7090 RepID=A0A8R2LZL4_BOMMO|nr:uncharacterized protein LOC114252765 [Bombyx mandarina]XP_037870006.1 uncharacterized protein LOC119629146 [Bombyx mori]
MSSTESESVSNAEYESLSQKIIVEVQKRPALYDTTLRQYSDRNVKNKLWEEVYHNVVNNWMTLSEAEKKKKGSTIQKKWKNMRDSFSKELAIQRGKSGQGAIKKKKYVHFDSLLFLVPSLQKRETSSNIEFTSQDNPDTDLSETLPLTNSNRTPSSKKASKSRSSCEDYEQKLLNFLNTKENACEYDEDINFSQMIVPMLRKLNDDQKHFAKVEIMNILQKAKSFYPFETPIHNQRPRSHLSFTQTSSPQSYYTYSPSPPPTMPIMPPVSTPVRQLVSGPAKQTIYLPLNTPVPPTLQATVHSLQELEQQEQQLQYAQNEQEEPTAANYLSQFQEQ